jgi:hypothetical protein
VRQVLTFTDNRPIIKTLQRVDVVFMPRMIPCPVPLLWTCSKEGEMVKASSKFLAWPLIAYLPASALAVGLLATVMRLQAFTAGGKRFLDVFLAYALRFPDDFNMIRWVAPALGLAVLILLSFAVRSARPIVTIIPIRVLLLTLIAVLVILVKIISVAIPLTPSNTASGSLVETAAPLTVYLFLFVIVDLCLVFLATFLPAYRRLRKPPVS